MDVIVDVIVIVVVIVDVNVIVDVVVDVVVVRRGVRLSESWACAPHSPAALRAH